jgi:hypothetical protein
LNPYRKFSQAADSSRFTPSTGRRRTADRGSCSSDRNKVGQGAARIEQQLLTALDMHAVYRQDLRQATIVLTLTDTTIA